MNIYGSILLTKYLLFGMALSAFADTAYKVPKISSRWKFQTGNDASWSDPSLDDNDWKFISVGSPWEKQGFADYDGYAWYRLHVHIPGTLKKNLDFRKHGHLKITLGKIDDVDQTWLNGEVIGKTGEFPEAYNPAWSKLRVYKIPAHLIRWDADNVVAVRVFDGDGEGGMYEGPYLMEVATWGDFLKMDFNLGRGDGVFVQPKSMPIAATLRNATDIATSGAVQWIVEDDEGTILSNESSAAILPAQGEQRIPCDFSPTAAGFYRVTCVFRSEENGAKASASKILGYRPEEVQSALTREKDFDQFWQETLTALSAIKPNFKMIRKPALDTETHEVYEVEMLSLDGVRVRGWYEKLTTGPPSAALLRVPGYGEDMRPTGSSDPLAIFSFNVRGHGNSQDDVSGMPQDYWLRGLDDKQGYYYQGAYADCVRAIDFLASRPEIDATRIAVTGGSQGGGLSLVTAALDQRISLCAPDIPFMCDWVRYFKVSNWPEIDNWIQAQPYRSWAKTLRTMSYFDALNLASRIQCPVFCGLGLQDDTCPPATIFAVYNRLSVAKEYHIYPHAVHWVSERHHIKRRQWILDHFMKSD